MKIGGIDVGTTGCKISVYNELGELLGKAYEEYAVMVEEELAEQFVIIEAAKGI